MHGIRFDLQESKVRGSANHLQLHANSSRSIIEAACKPFSPLCGLKGCSEKYLGLVFFRHLLNLLKSKFLLIVNLNLRSVESKFFDFKPEGEDELKRKQLMELSIINGTYRPTNASRTAFRNFFII